MTTASPTLSLFNLSVVSPSWHDCIKRGMSHMNPAYLAHLNQSSDWLPGHEKIFSAFSLPLDSVNYVLFGESPYPRAASANGYAFWDADVLNLWSATGFSKKVNRATSLRNILKMLLIAEGYLDPQHTGQDDIAKLSKENLIQTNHELFNQLLHHGFLLLNATLVLQENAPHKDAREWRPFVKELLAYLIEKRPHITFILMGRIANEIEQLLPTQSVSTIYMEHPYNISFITNPKVIDFFTPFHLLKKEET